MIFDWTVVVAARTGSSSVHYCDESEATRIADATKRDGGRIIDGPRPLTDWETLTGKEREYMRRGGKVA